MNLSAYNTLFNRHSGHFSSIPSKPGYIGGFPFLFILRFLILFGIILRFIIHIQDYTTNFTYYIFLTIFFYFLFSIGYIFLIERFSNQNNRLYIIHLVAVLLDTITISIFYYFTKSTDSDFFLFYYLPLFIIAEYFSFRWLILSFSFISLCFFLVLLIINTSFPQAIDKPLLSFILTLYLPREVFFLSIAVFTFALRRYERNQNIELNRRKEEIQSLFDFSTKLDNLYDAEQVLRVLLKKTYVVTTGVSAYVAFNYFGENKFEVIDCKPEIELDENELNTIRKKIIDKVVKKHSLLQDKPINDNITETRLIGKKIESSIHYPIMFQNDVIGVLGICSSQKNAFSIDIKQYLEAMISQAETALYRVRLLNNLINIGKSSSNSALLHYQIDKILNKVTDVIGFDYATISLVDESRNVIEKVRGKNVPQGWIKRSYYDLTDSDIIADVVRTGNTEVLDKWDDRLNPEIYEKFGHKDLIRVVTPLVDDNGHNIGTLTGGCKKDRISRELICKNVDILRTLGRVAGKEIANLRTFHLIDELANNTLEVISADSLSIHVFSDEDRIFDVAVGNIDSNFINDYAEYEISSFFKGRGIRLVDLNDLDYEYLRLSSLLHLGISNIAIVPIKLGKNVDGIINFHYTSKDINFDTEMVLIEIFSRQIEIFIQNTLLFKDFSEETHKAYSITQYIEAIQSISTKRNLGIILKNIAQKMLYVLDADSILIFQYSNENNSFINESTTTGYFSTLKNDIVISNKELLNEIISVGKERFMNIDETPLSIENRKLHSLLNASEFVKSNSIKSLVAIPLKIYEKNEILGVMIVNYYTTINFSHSEKRLFHSLATSAAIAIKIKSIRYLEQKLIPLRLINNISSKIQGIPFSRDEIIELILLSLLHIKRLRLTHALFFVKGKNNFYKGLIGFGHSKKENAINQLQKIDDIAIDKYDNGFTTLDHTLKNILDEVKKGEKNKYRRELFIKMKGIMFQETEALGSINRCIRYNNIVQVKQYDDDDDIKGLINRAIENMDTNYSAISIPIILNNNETYGVLIIDNKYHPNQNDYTNTELSIVQGLSNLIAQTVNNSQLREFG